MQRAWSRVSSGASEGGGGPKSGCKGAWEQCEGDLDTKRRQDRYFKNVILKNYILFCKGTTDFTKLPETSWH